MSVITKVIGIVDSRSVYFWRTEHDVFLDNATQTVHKVYHETSTSPFKLNVDLTRAVKQFMGVTDALQKVHELGFVHGDVWCDIHHK